MLKIGVAAGPVGSARQAKPTCCPVGIPVLHTPAYKRSVGQNVDIKDAFGSNPTRRSVAVHAIDAVLDVLTNTVAHLPLAYEPVALPCSMMKCGDVIHRETLDLVARGEETGPDWRTFVLLAMVGAYLVAPPGVLPGAVDYYILAKLRNNKAYGKDDIVLGRKLATGGFGTVFRGEMRLENGEKADVIVKKAKEFGQAEAWMNERMMRLPGMHCAEFITAFDESLSMRVSPAQAQKMQKAAPGAAPVWLVWRYEGDNNLYNLMESRDFPYNLEPLLLDRELRLPKSVQRKAVTIKLALKQLIEALAAAHGTGIVHRDVKPQNCILSERDKKIKLIDLGAAADLRVGINFSPQEYLLDPRYAPPQQYVTSTQTPEPPPAPVAAFLSPVLWRMENPDRFDMWSCGVTLIQMAFPALRNDNAIIAWNKKMKGLNYDLRAWRREEESRKGGMKPDIAEGFQLLDLDNGAGWQLLCSLMEYKPTDRCSASEALLQPFFTGLEITSPAAPAAAVAASQTLITNAGKAINKALDNQVFTSFASSATGEDRGALTEAQLYQELEGLDTRGPEPSRRASSTIVWWKERQDEMRKDIEKRESNQTPGLPMKGNVKNGSGKVGLPRRSASPPASGLPNGNGNGAGGNGNGRAAAAAKIRTPSPPLPVNGNGGSETRKIRVAKNALANIFGGLTASSAWKALSSKDATVSETANESSEEEEDIVLVGQQAGEKPGMKFLGGFLKNKANK